MPRATLFALLLLATSARAESPVPVVVAVDTSRSLSAAELGRIVAGAQEVLRSLPAGTPVGLLAFDDAPRWVVEPTGTAEAVGRGLAELVPAGSFTQLHDALFAAATRLPDGGVVLLFTDGRDESSATTVEDIARRSEAQGVRILAVGVGRPVEERALRRLALVTDGAYLGRLADAANGDLGRRLGEARGAVAAVRAERAAAAVAAAPPPPSPPPPAPAEAAAATTATAPSGPGLAWIAAGVAALLAVLLAIALLRRRRPEEPPPPASCPRCGRELAAEGAECPACGERELKAQLAGREVATAAEVREVTGDTVVFEQLEPGEALEKTRVLTELSVLLVRQRGEDQRAFVLGPTKAFGVGRIQQGNSLMILDPALSAHHFKIVPDGHRFFFIDLDSTNGSTVNGDRVSARELKDGDVIRAGQVELELKTRTGPLL